jgi:hypothetical protein
MRRILIVGNSGAAFDPWPACRKLDLPTAVLQ